MTQARKDIASGQKQIARIEARIVRRRSDRHKILKQGKVTFIHLFVCIATATLNFNFYYRNA